MSNCKGVSIREDVSTPQLVGTLDIEKIHTLIGVSLQVTEVYIYRGAIKHIKKRHPGIWEAHGQQIPDIIANPDYVGRNPKEADSVELYKYITKDLLLAIKLDPSGYLFVSSLYDLHNAQYKIQKRLSSGRIVIYQ